MGYAVYPTYSVKLRLWKVSTFYFKIVARPTPLTVTITPRRQTRRGLIGSFSNATTVWPTAISSLSTIGLLKSLTTTPTTRIITLCRQTRRSLLISLCTSTTLWPSIRSEIGRCSTISELRGSDCMFTTTFDSNWLKTKTLAVSRVGWAVQALGLHYSCGQRSCK